MHRVVDTGLPPGDTVAHRLPVVTARLPAECRVLLQVDPRPVGCQWRLPVVRLRISTPRHRDGSFDRLFGCGHLSDTG